MGLKPTELAMFLLKMNIFIFIITLGVNSLSIFPYWMHLNQINNNISLDVANSNYVKDSTLNSYLGHLILDYGDENANTFSILTFKESKFSNVRNAEVTTQNVSKATKDLGVTAFASPVTSNNKSYSLGTPKTVVLNVQTTSGQSLILEGAPTSFNPIENNTDLNTAMTSGYGNGKLVNRGVPFKSVLKTRFKLTGAAFGFFITTALPITVETVGVTTQYYQYD